MWRVCYSQSGTLQQQVNGNINWVAFIFKNSFCIRINFKGISSLKLCLKMRGSEGYRNTGMLRFQVTRTEIELFISVGSSGFLVARVNYMSPTLNIKPNQCLIIDAIAFYTGVPLVLETSSKEAFCITVFLRLRSLATIPTHFSLVFLIDEHRKSVKEREGMEN